jgi:type IV pilus assembly protein PilA
MYFILTLPLALATNQPTFAFTPAILWLLIGIVFGAIELLIQKIQPQKYRFYVPIIMGVSALIQSLILWIFSNEWSVIDEDRYFNWWDFHWQIFYWMGIFLALSICIRPIFMRVKGCYSSGCLVLLMVLWIFAAIALPAFLTKVRSVTLSEAKQYVASMNRGQQAYFAENSVFATSLNALKLGLRTETNNYKYSFHITKKAAFTYGVSKEHLILIKSYVGGVFVVTAKNVEPNAAKDTTSIICEADSPGRIKPADPTYQNGKIACGQGTTPVTR